MPKTIDGKTTVTLYCLHCKEKKDTPVSKVTFKSFGKSNGITCTCPECGKRMNRFIKKEDAQQEPVKETVL